MLSDPSSTVVQTDCITKTKDTGIAISKMFDVSRYTGWLDVINYMNVVSIKSQNQFQNCGVDKYMARFDAALSQIPQASGMLVNTATQVTQWLIMGQPTDFQPGVIKSFNTIYTEAMASHWDKVA